MGTFDPILNLAKVTVSGTYDADDITINLQAGDGAKLPQPSNDGSFNLVWWNSTDYNDPADDPNVEIVRCTARSTDQLTVTRAQESTAGSTKNTADKVYKMILAMTKKMIDDIEAASVPNEDFSGSLNGATTSFNTAHTFKATTLKVYWNRGRLRKDTDYTEKNGQTGFDLIGDLATRPPISGHTLIVDYTKVV